MKKLTTTVASARALLALAWDRIVSFVERIRAVKDATDKALAQIDKGVRALEAAEVKAVAGYDKAQARVETVIASFHESYEVAAAERREAARKIDRAARLRAKYTA